MKNIVKIENSEMVVSINDISNFSENKVKSIRDLIIRNEKEFESLGLRIVKEYDLKSQSEMKLNEEQTTFLMILMRNSPKIVEFKFNLVKQFMKLKDMVCETNKAQLEQKDKHIEKLSSKVYAKPRGNGLETVVRTIKNNQINITPYDLNKILVEVGILNVQEIKINKYTSLNMDGDTPLIHEETVVKLCDDRNIKRGYGYFDEHPSLFEV